jgi:hypothetical protein
MFNLLEKLINQKKSNNLNSNQYHKTEFLNRPEHLWVKNNSAATNLFDQTFSRSPSILTQFMLEKHVSFILSRNFSKLNIHQPTQAVIVFPQFERWILGGEKFMSAYILHELALMIYELNLNSPEQDPLLAEVEADKFLCDIGYGDQLEQFLLKLDESPEKRLRLSYLTWKQLGIC